MGMVLSITLISTGFYRMMESDEPQWYTRLHWRDQLRSTSATATLISIQD
jgi:hypothetical protein